MLAILVVRCVWCSAVQVQCVKLHQTLLVLLIYNVNLHILILEWSRSTLHAMAETNDTSTSSSRSAEPELAVRAPSGGSATHHPPTHKPLTHNPPSPTAGKAPWASSPATGSPFPQLARPDTDLGVISSSTKADRMSPTAAPWVAAPAMGPPSSQLVTGKPVPGKQLLTN